MQMFMTTACIAARWINTSQTVWFRMLVFGIFVLCSITKQGYIDAKRHTQLQEQSPPYSDEEGLYRYLFHRGYNRDIRPVRHSTEAVHIQLTFSLKQIHTLDEKSQVFRTYGWLIVEWLDKRLAWENQQKFENLSEFVVDSVKIWTPELALINAGTHTFFRVQGNFPDFSEYRAIILPSGNVRWEPAGSFDTSCKIDISFYPYDRQSCELVFGTWTYTTYKVNLTNSTAAVILDDYNTSGEWDISSTLVQRREFVYEANTHIRFSKVAFMIGLERKHRFYTMNLILPCAMLSSLTLVTFLSPPDQGEKISLGISILLSFSVFMLTLSENMPKTSETLPLFGVYTTFVMFMNTTSVMLTVLVLNLHHRNERKPVPGWVRTVAFDFLARVLCMRSKNENYYQQNGYNRPEVEPKAQSQLRERKKKQKSDSYNLAYAARQFSTNLPSSAVMFTPNNSTSSPTENATYTESKSSYRSRVHEDHKAQYASVPREPTGGGAGSDADTPPYDHYMHPHPEHQQWKALARIVDRLFFWLTLFALISASLGTFCLLWS